MSDVENCTLSDDEHDHCPICAHGGEAFVQKMKWFGTSTIISSFEFVLCNVPSK